MEKELKPVNCGCGGEAQIAKKYLMGNLPDVYVLCRNCSIRTGEYYSEAEAITAWNRAMGSTEKSSTVERTAKAKKSEFQGRKLLLWLVRMWAVKEYRTILPLVPSLINTALEVQKKGKTIG